MNLSNIFGAPRTTVLGAVPGGVLIEDGIRELTQTPDNAGAWVRLVIGILAVIIGGLMDHGAPKAPPNQKGRAEVPALVIAALCLLAVLSVNLAWGAANILTSNPTVSTTPAVIGVHESRALLSVAVPTAAAGGVDCGPADLPVAQWLTILPGMERTWGILYKAQFTAEKVMKCVLNAAQSTPVAIQVSEEGGMPDRTATSTATGTVTRTATPTATPANTNTATPVNTATRTNTPKNTRTNTPTSTPVNTATPSVTPT